MNKELFESILNKISDESFEDWYENETSSRNEEDFRCVVWYDFDENDFETEFEDYCLEQGKEHNPKEKEDYLELKTKEKAKEYYEDNISDFLDSLYDWDFIDESSLRIYRAVQIANEEKEDFVNSLKNNTKFKNYEGVGKYWSFCKNSAQAHWAENFNQPSRTLKITGVVLLKQINIKQTLLLNMDTSIGLDEKEIRLNEGDFIFIESVDDITIENNCVI